MEASGLAFGSAWFVELQATTRKTSTRVTYTERRMPRTLSNTRTGNFPRA